MVKRKAPAKSKTPAKNKASSGRSSSGVKFGIFAPFQWLYRWKGTLCLAMLFAGTLLSFFPEVTHKLAGVYYEAEDAVIRCFVKYDNLDLGIPGNADRVINRQGYALGYSEKYEQPLWVIYKLERTELIDRKVKRTDDFRRDPRIFSGSATPEDYKGSDYDRGHLAPAADMGWSYKAMSQSFYMSNMSPQDEALNRGRWKDLEDWVRENAKKAGALWVISGPIFYPDRNIRHIGGNLVSVPHAYYKVIYDSTPPEKMIGFILPNADCNKKLSSYACDVDKIEGVTKLYFFPALPPEKARRLKNSYNFSDWDD